MDELATRVGIALDPGRLWSGGTDTNIRADDPYASPMGGP